MSYIPPQAVTSPQVSISNLEPIYDGGEESYSIAALHWDHHPRIALRWNGKTEPGALKPHPGNPQSRGLPTWFVIPDQFDAAILNTILEQKIWGGEIVDKEAAYSSALKALEARLGGSAQIPAPKVSLRDLEDTIERVVLRMKAAGVI